MAATLHSAPKPATIDGIAAALSKALGKMLIHAREEHGEVVLSVKREKVEDALRLLRDEHQYQQLMEIAGVDYPARDERFEVVYMLLSLTRNHRIMVKCRAAENTPVPTVTTLWPNAGWLEREVFDMYGVLFDGTPICAGSSPITGSKATRSARTSAHRLSGAALFRRGKARGL